MLKKLLIFLLFILLNLSLFSNDKVINLTAGNYPPYQAENLKHYGVVSRIVTEAFALEGIKVNYTFMPWKRAYLNILEGKLDGVGYATKKKKRLEHFYFSKEPILQKKRVFFHKKDFAFDWHKIEDLKGLQIGAASGYKYNDAFDEADKNGTITTQRVLSHKQNIEKLLVGRVDIVLTTIDQGLYILQTKHKDLANTVTYHPKLLQSANMHLMLSKKVEKNKEMIKLFNKGLKKLKESGKYEQYFKESQRGEYIIQ